MILKKKRIVTDKFLGFEVQTWRLWWPFWSQDNFTNTHSSVSDAEDWINSKPKKWESKVVKYL